LHDESIVDFNSEVRGNRPNGFPANRGIGTEFLAFDKSYSTMAEIVQVLKGKHRGARMVENDIGDAGHFSMTRDGDGGNLQSLGDGRVHGNESFDGALLQEQRIFFEKIRAVAMAYHKLKIAFL